MFVRTGQTLTRGSVGTLMMATSFNPFSNLFCSSFLDSVCLRRLHFLRKIGDGHSIAIAFANVTKRFFAAGIDRNQSGVVYRLPVKFIASGNAKLLR